MKNFINKKRYELLQRHIERMFNLGMEVGKIQYYSDELIEKLRKVYYHGIPLSVIFLNTSFCDGKCFDCAYLLSKAFNDDECNLLFGYDKSIYLKNVSEGENIDLEGSEHCVLEVKDEDGVYWIYDTSIGLMIEKNFYKRMYSFKEKQETEILAKVKDSDITYELNPNIAPSLVNKFAKLILLNDDEYNEKLRNEFRIFLLNLIEINPNIKDKLEETCLSLIDPTL